MAGCRTVSMLAISRESIRMDLSSIPVFSMILMATLSTKENKSKLRR